MSQFTETGLQVNRFRVVDTAGDFVLFEHLHNLVTILYQDGKDMIDRFSIFHSMGQNYVFHILQQLEVERCGSPSPFRPSFNVVSLDPEDSPWKPDIR